MKFRTGRRDVRRVKMKRSTVYRVRADGAGGGGGVGGDNDDAAACNAAYTNSG